MKAITIKQPWASLIIEPDPANPGFGIKPIENRTWECPPKYIGKRVLIHAATKKWGWIEVLNYLSEQCRVVLAKHGYDAQWLKTLPTGAIIGSVEIVDCAINNSSIWAERTIIRHKGSTLLIDSDKMYNWVLANPIKFPEPIPEKGKLSFWDYPNILAEHEHK
ncbi:MAG: ASCH domain-containing protein [Acholeplasmataceae bacterium]|nr:ASCH domain-containing protein [Acholeplasmataceae bacterium]